MITNEILRSLRLIAIKNSYSNSLEWYVENACRYYSKTYHTPLQDVYKLNPIEVVKVYMEDESMNMTPEDLTAAEARLTVKHKPLLDLEQFTESEVEELSDDEWVAQQMAQAALKDEPKKDSKPKDTLDEAAVKAMDAMKNLYKDLNLNAPETLEGDMKFGKEE